MVIFGRGEVGGHAVVASLALGNSIPRAAIEETACGFLADADHAWAGAVGLVEWINGFKLVTAEQFFRLFTVAALKVAISAPINLSGECPAIGTNLRIVPTANPISGWRSPCFPGLPSVP